MNTCIVFNPAARGEKARKFQEGLRTLHGRFALKPTQCAGGARLLAAEAVREGYETIVAAGGDGTLNEVLNGIADVPDGFQRARLAVLPMGTINVFARELKIPARLPQVWEIVETGKEVDLDVGVAEFKSAAGPESRLFLQLAGAGLDARAVELVDWDIKKKIGPGAYLVAGFSALRSQQPRITVSNGSERATGDLILIGNGKLYGGNYPIFHKSDLQDGVLDAVVFERVDWKSLPSLGIDFLLGRLFKDGKTKYLQGPSFELDSPTRSALQLDGEFAGELPARISVRPRLLRVIVP